jgi:hypothetical protein
MAMPSPGKALLSRFHRVKGPVYRHASLCGCQLRSFGSLGTRRYEDRTHALAHGSFFTCPADAAHFLGSKPVMEGPFGAIVMLPPRSAPVQVKDGWIRTTVPRLYTYMSSLDCCTVSESRGGESKSSSDAAATTGFSSAFLLPATSKP